MTTENGSLSHMMMKMGAITYDCAVIIRNLPSVTDSVLLLFLQIDRCKDLWSGQRSYASFINRGQGESTFIYGQL